MQIRSSLKLAFISLAGLLLSLPSSRAQDQPVPIKLSVIHNGKPRPIPPVIKLQVDTHAADLLVRDDQLLVPVEFAHAESFMLLTIIDREEIRIDNLSSRELKSSNWTILLADHHYDDQYRASIPKDADIRASCLLALTSAGSDPPNIIFVPECRLRHQPVKHLRSEL